MKEIELTQGKIALVDDEDFEYLNQFKWHAIKSRNTFYGCRLRNLRMHREIMKVKNTNVIIDHIDGNGLNNQKYNLRICSVGENNKNRHTVNNFSGYLGVSRVTSKCERWQANIRVNGKTLYLGSFKDKKDAAKAYNENAIKFHKEFARINIIE